MLLSFARSAPCDVTGVTAVGETPEKKQDGSKVMAERTSAPSIVAETMSSSYNTAQNTNSQRKKPESKPTGSSKTELQMH